MFHNLLTAWFHFVEHWGYLGVFLLMALESSIVPIPSEIVMPPAAYWASQGRMDFWLVVLAGTAGSWFGSAANYFLAQWLGGPFLRRYGKYILMPSEKLVMAEKWVVQYGMVGIFVARLLPVVRHLISIPAGILRMRFHTFSIATLIGSFLWCTILSWFGVKILGDQPDLMSNPEALVRACRENLGWFVFAVIGFSFLYTVMLFLKNRQNKKKF